MNPSVHPQLSLRLPAWRTRFVFALFAAGFLVLVGRTLYLQVLQSGFLQGQGERRYASQPLELPAHRGMITDRNGELVAISTPMESVWASVDDVDLTPTQHERLAKLLEMTPAELKGRLVARKHGFVYLKRHLPPEQAAKVVALDLPGVSLLREYRRYYPAGDTMAHVLGFTDVDDKGQEGLELAFQNWLAGRPGSRKVIRDRRGHVVEDVASIRAPQEGRDLQLSIDLKLQYLAFRELKAAVHLHQAKAGSIVVLDVKTGEVLALANVPAYNPNNRGRYNASVGRNRAITDLFEPGSTLKPFTVAAALESGAFRADSVVATAGGSLTLGPATIRDAHVSPVNLTVSQVIQRSSNVGTAKMALAMPSQRLWEMFSAVGFGALPRSGFPGEAGGRLRDYHTWRPIEQATMSYGHGISVSLMQLARAYTIFCNDGELLPITLVRRDDPVAGIRVVSADTAAALRRMMQMVIEPGGTAPRAQVLGYHVAGKTGTAHKLVNHQYAADQYASSFIGFAPASDPRLLIAVLIDEPSAGQYYGGVVAAPVFSAVMSGALRMLSIPPDMPVIRKGPIDDVPEVAEEV